MPVRKEMAVQAPPPALGRACPGRNVSSAAPAPDALEKAATLSSKRRLCSSALLHTDHAAIGLLASLHVFLFSCRLYRVTRYPHRQTRST